MFQFLLWTQNIIRLDNCGPTLKNNTQVTKLSWFQGHVTFDVCVCVCVKEELHIWRFGLRSQSEKKLAKMPLKHMFIYLKSSKAIVYILGMIQIFYQVNIWKGLKDPGIKH